MRREERRPVPEGVAGLLGTRAVHRPRLRESWRGPSLLVLDDRGLIGEEELTGYYFRETRYLSRLELRVQGERPVPCSVASAAPHEQELTLIHPPARAGAGGGSGSGGDHRHRGLTSRSLELAIRFRVRPASLMIDLELTSRWDEHAEVELEWILAADFLGVLEALGDPLTEVEVRASAADSGVRFRRMDPALPLETRITAHGAGEWRWTGAALLGRLALARQEPATVALEVRAQDPEDPMDPEAEGAREAYLLRHLAGLPRLHSPAEPALPALAQLALHELGSAALLEGPEEEWLMPAAGYPLYPAAFGRDAATASWQSAVFDHGALTRGTAAFLQRLQGTRDDPSRDERLGRIIQQARQDPASRLGLMPFDRYYGDVASPFMYIISLANAYAWSGDRGLVERHWDSMCRVLEWARTDGDPDGDGYIEYRTRSPAGPRHQAWKDSDNAVVDEQGRQVGAPFASCETQGYYMAALQCMAGFALVLGHRTRALSLWKEALRLKRRFNRDFWLEEEGYVAFGLDAEKRPLRVLTSNAAQCIATGIVSDEHLPRLVRRIFEPDLFSGWGIRTLSTENPAYHPLSYHLGSVWPVENGSILFGLRRYGLNDRVLQLARALLDLALIWPGGRVPECVGGHPRGHRAHPGAYPRANSFQSWNQSIFPMLLQALLGAWSVAALRVLVLDPVLPPWLPEVTVRGWRVGEATLSLRFHRGHDGESSFEVLEQSGRLRIVRQPPVESLTTGLRDRLGRLARDVARL